MHSCLKVLRQVSQRKSRNLSVSLSQKYSNTASEQINQQESEKQTHFGFQTVTEDEKAQKVYEVFADVANNYDKMNDAMSLGIHRLWKDAFVNRLAPSPKFKILDVAGGTGDIAFRIATYQRTTYGNAGEITVCDINESMLEEGKRRAARLGFTNLNWVQGDAQNLENHQDNAYDAYTIAFGIRNVVRIDEALKEAYRVLKPGGRFMCLEFSHVNDDTLRWLYDQYSMQVIPVVGQLIAGQWKAYQYLVESIRRFPRQNEFSNLIQDAGFQQVNYEDLTFGVVAIHSGFKL